MDKEPALATSFDELKKKNESHYMAAARKRLALTAVLIFLKGASLAQERLS